MRRQVISAACALLIGAAACSDGTTGTGTARFSVAITDAADTLLASAVVHIGEVQLLPEDGPPIVVASEGGTFDLLTLQNGVTATLGTIEDLEPGTYLQLRMIVDSAAVALKDGLQFNDGSQEQSLKVPSGAQTGIKISLDAADGDPDTPGIEIAPGNTILVIDFDVSQNFVPKGNIGTPAGLNGFNFTPSLRATVTDVAGSIAGTVVDVDGNALAGVEVTAELTDDAGLIEELQTTSVSVTTGEDGTYALLFLAPGAYDVTAVLEGVTFETATVSVTVSEAEDVTGIDFAEADDGG